MTAIFDWPVLLPELKGLIRRILEDEKDIGRDVLRHTCKSEWKVRLPGNVWMAATTRNYQWFKTAARLRYHSINHWVVEVDLTITTTPRRYLPYVDIALEERNTVLATWLDARGFSPSNQAIVIARHFKNKLAIQWLISHGYIRGE